MNLNIGCGCDWEEQKDYVGVDNIDFGQRYVHDITQVPWPLDKNSVDVIRAWNILEHIEVSKIIDVMNECHRILKPGGILDIIVPRSDYTSAISDPTHKSKWQCLRMEGDKLEINVFWDGKPPKAQFCEKSFTDYFAGGKPRNADYGLKKWAIENKDGKYTTEVGKRDLHIKLIK